MVTRRNFIKKAVVGSAALSFGGVLEGFSAKSYNNIVADLHEWCNDLDAVSTVSSVKL